MDLSRHEHPMVHFGEYLFGRPKSPEIFGFHLIFFGKTSPKTQIRRGLIGQLRYSECKIRPASIFGEPLAALKFSG